MSITKIHLPMARSGTLTFCCKSRQWCYLIKTRSILLDTVGAVSPSQEGLNTDTLASLRLSPTADQSENARQSIRAAALPQRVSFQHRGLYNHQSDTWIVSSCLVAPTTFDRRFPRGGNAAVYVAIDQRTQLQVACKVISLHVVEQYDIWQKLKVEIELLSRLQHVSPVIWCFEPPHPDCQISRAWPICSRLSQMSSISFSSWICKSRLAAADFVA